MGGTTGILVTIVALAVIGAIVAIFAIRWRKMMASEVIETPGDRDRAESSHGEPPVANDLERE